MVTFLALQFIEDIPKPIQYILFAIEVLYIAYKFIYLIRSTSSSTKDVSKLMDKIPEIVSLIKSIFDKSKLGEIGSEELNEINKILEDYKNNGKSNDTNTKD